MTRVIILVLVTISLLSGCCAGKGDRAAKVGRDNGRGFLAGGGDYGVFTGSGWTLGDYTYEQGGATMALKTLFSSNPEEEIFEVHVADVTVSGVLYGLFQLEKGSIYVHDNMPTSGMKARQPAVFPWHRPRVKTTRTTSIADGSRYIVRDNNDNDDYVYCLGPSGAKVHVFDRSGNLEGTIDAGKYARFYLDGVDLVMDAPANLPEPGKDEFFDDIMRKLGEAGNP